MGESRLIRISMWLVLMRLLEDYRYTANLSVVRTIWSAIAVVARSGGYRDP